MRLPVFSTQTATPAIGPPGMEPGSRSIGSVKVLRISVTDRCNYRCLYCMPAEGVRWLPRQDILTFDEIADVVRAAIEVHGIRRFKLTGGEPTMRHGLLELVRLLRGIAGIEDLSLTTNGERLLELAGPLKECGLDRVTVSLDSLRPDRFRRITRTGNLGAVLSGLDRAADVGFTGTKINCVVMRSTNDDELADFAALTLDRPVTVRFIEYMPLGDAALMHLSPGMTRRLDGSETGPAGGCGAQDRGVDVFVSEQETRASVEAAHGPLQPVSRLSEPGVGPAEVYRLPGAAGRIGFISAMSAPFCSSCNRLRLTADGVLRSCLFEGGEVPIRELVRTAADRSDRHQALGQAMADCVRLKPETHSSHGSTQMSRLGG